MKAPARIAILAAAIVILVGGAFYGGLVYQQAKAGTATASGLPADGAGRAGGPMADLTEEEQAELDSMTEEERQAWMEENFAGQGGMPGANGVGGPTRGGTIDGEVLEVADDTITVSLDSGSQTFYLDEDTVLAYVQGAGELAAGSTVMVVATPTADGVTTASLVVVK